MSVDARNFYRKPRSNRDCQKCQSQEPNVELELEMQKVRETYERDLDAKYSAARGFVDAVIAPEETRDALELALLVSLNYSGPHLGQFVLPANLA